MKFLFPIFILVLAVLSFNCTGIVPKHGRFTSALTDMPSLVVDADKTWLQEFNKAGTAFKDLYMDDALLVTPEGTLVRGNAEIASYYASNHFSKGAKISSNATLYWCSNSTAYYTISVIKQTAPVVQDLLYISVWQDDGTWKRKVEAWAIRSNDVNLEGEIEAMERKWEKVYIARDWKKTVPLYETGAVIYYGYNFFLSNTNIAMEFLKDTSGSWTLKPLAIVSASGSQVFEINVSVRNPSGAEYYNIFAWRKGSDGTWRLYLESSW